MRVAQFALPNDKRVPSRVAERLNRFAVALDVSRKFGLPIVRARFRHPSTATSGIDMDVPKTAVNEDHLTPSREGKVRATRQISTVQPEPISGSMQQRSNQLFGPSALAANRPHNRASLSWRKCVNHPILTLDKLLELITDIQVVVARVAGHLALPVVQAALAGTDQCSQS